MLDASPPWMALVDCNNFYVSCERLFNPALKHVPVIVLSNNDGCAIARSNEAKALGIQMGDPYYQIKDLCARHNVQALSSNFTLYGDISQRVMTRLKTYAPQMEVYSIDEAFLDFGHHPLSPRDLKAIRQDIFQKTGIPISIGLGATKTLAKVANRFAKKTPHGIYGINDANHRKSLMQTPLEDIWGIGRQLSKKLMGLGLKSAWDVACLPSPLARKLHNVMSEQTQRELNGQRCFPLETHTHPKKSIMVSRSFKTPVVEKEVLQQILCQFVENGAAKLRAQKKYTRALGLFLRTNRFQPGYARLENECRFRVPLQETAPLQQAVQHLLREIYAPHHAIKKAGILLHGFEDVAQPDLFLGATHGSATISGAKLDQTLDQLNQRFGKRALFYGATGLSKKSLLHQEHKSPAYTTQWDCIPTVG